MSLDSFSLRRGLLLDRDGVINIEHGYVGKQEQFEFVPGLFPFLQAAQDLGFRLAILTNQSGVARGKYSVNDYNKLNRWMLGELTKQGITIDLTLACFEHTEGTVAPYIRESFWRKPHPGMVLEAIQRLRLDPAHSAFLGDKISDMKAAQKGGIAKLLLFTNETTEKMDGVTMVKNFNEALELIQR